MGCRFGRALEPCLLGDMDGTLELAFRPFIPVFRPPSEFRPDLGCREWNWRAWCYVTTLRGLERARANMECLLAHVERVLHIGLVLWRLKQARALC